MEITCSIFENKVCKDFDERKCMLCQLRNQHNRELSLIFNDIEGHYERNNDGLIRVFTVKSKCKKQKSIIENKLIEIIEIKNMIQEIQNLDDESLKNLIEG
ncbi:hypothetical protein KKH23_05565 [Patescibacteria group bacterium]|nr:hypothetical protein [Patescibacteria group bacterium]MBU0846639.1 hypothetical protein [Patescibacteria group bacterium]